MSLSDSGRATLRERALPEGFRNMHVISSPLRRCVETATELGIEPALLESRIVEMDWGEWEGRKLGELRAELGQAMRDNEARGFDFEPPGGESPRRVLARVAEWLAEIAKGGQPTVALAHRGVIRVVFASAVGWDMRGRPPLKLDWSALQVFSVDGSGSPTLLHANLPMAESRSRTGKGAQ